MKALATSPHPRTRGKTAERPGHKTCPGEKHSTAHTEQRLTGGGFHFPRLLSDELIGL